jgi:hypothetical protein
MKGVGMVKSGWIVAVIGLALLSVLIFGHGHTPDESQANTLYLQVIR